MNYKQSIFIISLVITLSALTLGLPTLYAQEETASPETPVPTVEAVPLAQPFNQADLSVITGNTQRPNGMVWHNEMLYTACSGDWTVYEINSITGDTAQYIYGVRNAHTLYAADINDEFQLWIPDFQTDSLVLLRRGRVETITAALNGPWGIDQIDEEIFIVTNLRGNNALMVNVDGTTREIITNLRSPTGVAVDEEYIYIANTGSARRAIEWFEREQVNDETAETALEADQIGNPLVTGLQNVTNITLGNDGLLYFAYALGTRGVVARVQPDVCIANGGCSSEQIESVVYTELAVPLAGLTLSPDMRLYVHSMFSPDLYWVQLPVEEPSP